MSAPDLSFRPAQPGDLESLVSLVGAYYAEDGYPFAQAAARSALARLLANPNYGRAWIAHGANEPAGYAVLTFGFSLEYGGRDAFVDELFIVDRWRGRGLGTRAMALMVDACVAAGVRALHLEVERGKPAALELYRRQGFVDHRRMLMTRLLADEPVAPRGAEAS